MYARGSDNSGSPMLDVRYDPEMMQTIDSTLAAAAELLDEAAKLMKLSNNLSHDTADAVLETAETLAQWLTTAEKGFYVPPWHLEEITRCEALATKILLDLDEAS